MLSVRAQNCMSCRKQFRVFSLRIMNCQPRENSSFLQFSTTNALGTLKAFGWLTLNLREPGDTFSHKVAPGPVPLIFTLEAYTTLNAKFTQCDWHNFVQRANIWAGGLKLGYFSFVCPWQLFLLQICQFPVNSESFWAFSMSKNILFINIRDWPWFLLVRKTYKLSSETKKYTYISKQITKSP